MKKLTRKQIAEGLEAVPLEVVLLGAAGTNSPKLSPKDREFARQIALGESKASAFRKSRPSKGKPETQSRRGQELAKRGPVQAQIEAFKVAIERQKYATPAHLRALVIDQLTQTAISDATGTRERLRALELLGKITEVAAFTERREIVQVQDARQIKEKLLSSLRLAISSSALDVDPGPIENTAAETPPPPTTPESAEPSPAPLLSIPHIRSDENCAVSGVTSPVTPEENSHYNTCYSDNINEINDLQGPSALTNQEISVTVGGVGAKSVGGFKDVWGEKAPLSEVVPSGGWK